MKQDISGLVIAVLLTKMIAQAIQNLSLRVAKPLWKRKGAISQELIPTNRTKIIRNLG